MKFWDTQLDSFDKKVLVVPNYTHFGEGKNINADPFVLVMKSFLDNTDYNNLQFIIPYPNGSMPTDFMKYKNVKLINMGNVSTFPPLMRIQFPDSAFKKIFSEEGIDIYFNEDNWLFFHVDYDEVVEVEIGAIINDKDEFEWKFRG